ncbi:DNA repair protein [Cedecea neteri]|uniref:DNA repair protein n=1 Tax=Cedecea neteri TaxID=158822 RepID=A0AAN0VU34_9ENTR|nr:type II toxin-antitoxin system HicB family antitoxin [Cedecea neteri]AIR61972.1 DNA repair protein [Cedecea neteri]
MTTAEPLPNIMIICGQPALITWVSDINLFRGKFLGLTGYCDFVADSASGLIREGETSLQCYLEDCSTAGIEPFEKEEKMKTFTLRYPESFGEHLAIAAAEQQMSLNSYIIGALTRQLKNR